MTLNVDKYSELDKNRYIKCEIPINKFNEDQSSLFTIMEDNDNIRENPKTMAAFFYSRLD